MTKYVLSILYIPILYFYLFSSPLVELQETETGYSFSLQIPPLVLTDTTVKATTDTNTNFTKVEIPHFLYTGDIGDPQLLTREFDMAIEDNEPTITLENITQKVIDLKHPLFPVQYLETFSGLGQTTFIYNNPPKQMSYTAPFVHKIQTFSFRGQRAVSIAINPLQYNPSKKTLTVLQSCNVIITMEKPRKVYSWNSSEFDILMRDKFINFKNPLGRSVISEPFNEKAKYLIITSPTYKDNVDLSKFIEYRKSTGFDVECVSTADVGGTTKDNFKTFIRNKKPVFCLLVGTAKDFPQHSVNITVTGVTLTIKSYVYYVSSTTTKMKPDISLGLFFCRQSSGLKNIVDKTIATEKNLSSMPKINVLFGGNDQPVGGETADQCDRIIKNVFTNYFKPLGYTAIEAYQVLTPKGGKKEVSAAINKGVRFVNYNGHGLETGWEYGSGMFTSSDVKALTNTFFPFVLSSSCLTGTFDGTGECFAETWTNEPKGASAFIGSYQLSSLGQHSLNRGVYRAIIEKKLSKYGMAFMNSESYVFDSVSSKCDAQMQELCVTQYHYFGDPAIETMQMAPTDIGSTTMNTIPLFSCKILPAYTSLICLVTALPSKQPLTFTIYTPQGKVIYQNRLPVSNSGAVRFSWNFNTSDSKRISAGSYFVRVTSGKDQFKKQFIVMP